MPNSPVAQVLRAASVPDETGGGMGGVGDSGGNMGNVRAIPRFFSSLEATKFSL